MTESEWVAAADPRPMLAWLGAGQEVTNRKLRLVAAAVARRAWPLLTDERYRWGVEVAERFADGLAGVRDLPLSLEWVQGYDWLGGVDDVAHLAALPLGALDATGLARMSARVASVLSQSAFPDADFDHDSYLGAAESRATEFATHARLVRCIFGPLPFRRQVRLSPSLLKWSGGTVVLVARSAYADRLLPAGELDPARLAVLCDSLLDAGCPPDHELLQHLRGPGPHWRGCFAVDAILGRQ